MKKSIQILGIFLIGIASLMVSSLALGQEKVTVKQDLINAMQIIDSEILYNYIDTLSSEEFEGRLTGHIGYDKAAEWVITKFKEWGVKPLGTEDSFLQKFPHPYTEIFEPCEVKLHINTKDGEQLINYEYVEEFIPGSTSGNGEVTAEAVYVGYGITAPELGYDDYADIDVKGKIVVYEREVPLSSSDENFLKWRPYSFHQYKLMNAVKHGAAGMLYNYHISNPNNAYSADLVYSHVGDKVMADIFGKAKKHEKTIKKINKKLKPQSFETGKTFTIKNTTKHHPDGIGSNVIGFIEGSDPNLKNEYIFISGHLDHLGKCYTTMPGANDNASAVSVGLGLAKTLSESGIKLKRSVVFCFFGAEEAALKGVQFLLKNPPVPLENIKAVINMDGVGIGNSIHFGFAKNYPNLYSYFEKSNLILNSNIKGGFDKNISRPRLDAAFIDWYGIPVLSISTYWNDKTQTNFRYHTPYDNISNINAEISEELYKLIFLSLVEMDNKEDLDLKRGELKTEFIQ